MLKTLIYKELFLTSQIPMFIFMAFGAILLIPAYPYYVIFFFGCLGLFFTFQSARENKDTFYTAALPISKSNVVKARCLLVVIVQIGQILISIPFAVLRIYITPGGNVAGIEANPAFYGFVLIMLALFNAVFMINFYKTAYYVGRSFLIAMVPLWIYIIIMEALVHFPTFRFLDTVDPHMMVAQLPILGAGILIYIVGMVITFKISSSEFDKVDL